MESSPTQDEGTNPVGGGASVKSKIVNSCARGLYTHFMF